MNLCDFCTSCFSSGSVAPVLCIESASAIMAQVMKMIYVCDNCHFIFSRTAEPEQCPDCGKYTVRLADEAERQEYEEQLKKSGELRNG